MRAIFNCKFWYAPTPRFSLLVRTINTCYQIYSLPLVF